MFMCDNTRFLKAALQEMCIFAKTNEEAIAGALRTNQIKEDHVRNRHGFVWSLLHDVSTLIRSRVSRFSVSALRDFFAGVNGPDLLSRYTANHFDPLTMSRKYPHIDDLKRAAAALQHRRLCITQTGLLCLAPDEVKFGNTTGLQLPSNTATI